MRFLPIGIEAHHTCMAFVESTLNQTGREYRFPERTFRTAYTNLWLLGKPTSKPGFGMITKSTSGKTNSSPVKSALSEHCNCEGAAHAGPRIELSICRIMMIAIPTFLRSPRGFICEWMCEQFFVFGSPHVILLPALCYYLLFPLFEPWEKPIPA